MDSKLTLFSQIISKIDRVIFKKIVKEKKTDYRNKGFDSWMEKTDKLTTQIRSKLTTSFGAN